MRQLRAMNHVHKAATVGASSDRRCHRARTLLASSRTGWSEDFLSGDGLRLGERRRRRCRGWRFRDIRDCRFFSYLTRTCGPQSGIDVGEDVIAPLNLIQPRFLGYCQPSAGSEGLPDGFYFVELIVMRDKASFGIITGCTGGYEELPVRRFEQEQFAA